MINFKHPLTHFPNYEFKCIPKVLSCTGFMLCLLTAESTALSEPVRKGHAQGLEMSVSTAAWHSGWVQCLPSSAQAGLVEPKVLCSLQCICFLLFISSIFPIYCYSFWRETTITSQNQRDSSSDKGLMKPKVWSQKTLLSSCYILNALDFLCFFSFRCVYVSKHFFLCMSCLEFSYVLP